LIRLATLLVGVLLVGGCSAATPDVSPPAGAPTVSSTPTVRPVADPIAISIPKIGARSELIKLGLNADGSLEVPPVDQPGLGGWYAGADVNADGDEIKPSQRGSSVVAAHVDGVVNGRKGQPGLFFKLHELVAGDEVFVDQADGGQLRFLVERVQQVDKDSFPTAAVYEADDMPRLNLITCGGAFDRAAGHYVANQIVFTTLAPEQQ
jgi:Sortase domain